MLKLLVASNANLNGTCKIIRCLHSLRQEAEETDEDESNSSLHANNSITDALKLREKNNSTSAKSNSINTGLCNSNNRQNQAIRMSSTPPFGPNPGLFKFDNARAQSVLHATNSCRRSESGVQPTNNDSRGSASAMDSRTEWSTARILRPEQHQYNREWEHRMCGNFGTECSSTAGYRDKFGLKFGPGLSIFPSLSIDGRGQGVPNGGLFFILKNIKIMTFSTNRRKKLVRTFWTNTYLHREFQAQSIQ